MKNTVEWIGWSFIDVTTHNMYVSFQFDKQIVYRIFQIQMIFFTSSTRIQVESHFSDRCIYEFLNIKKVLKCIYDLLIEYDEVFPTLTLT